MSTDKNPNIRSLNFSVTGKRTTVEKVIIKQPLRIAVQTALDQTGSTRPIGDYDVIYNDKLNISEKVESFNFPEDAVIFISLKTGEGGE